MTEGTDATKPAKFQIFRRSEGRKFEDVNVMYGEATSEAAAQGWGKVAEAGYREGEETRLLFEMPGFSLTYAWFKSGLPLPLHSHDADCVYYIISGSLKIGSEVLEAGDGFFVGKDVPYAYVPGDKGLEILEFRDTNRFNIKFLAHNLDYWEKAADQIRSRKGAWASETRPAAALAEQ